MKQTISLRETCAQSWRWIAAVWLAARLLSLGWGVTVTQFLPSDLAWRLHESFAPLSLYQRAETARIESLDAILLPWFRWDTVWFMRIAMDGYNTLDGRLAFAPLYPMLIRLIGGLLNDHLMLAALVVSNISLLGACLLLYAITRRPFGERVARRAVLYLLVFPTSFFLWGAYSESLFLLLTLAAFWMAEQKHWGRTTLIGALVVLARFQGALFAIPLAWMWWRRTERDRPWRGVMLLIIPATLLAYIGIMRLGTVGTFPWSELANEWNKQWMWPWEGLVANIVALFGPGIPWWEALPLLLNLVSALGAIAALAVAFFQWNTAYALWGLCLLLPAICNVSAEGTLISVSRYVLTIFPIYVLLGKTGSKAWAHWLLFSLGLVLQVVLSLLYFEWIWVA